MTANTKPAPGELKFDSNDVFLRELRHRVDRYFETTGLTPRDCPRMYLKTALILGWCAGSYALLVFGPGTWWLVLPALVSLGVSMAAIGFNIQHDGGHGAYSEHRWINKLMAMTLDLLGGSSFVWARKHNAIHHTYSNITGHDDDISLGLLARVTPHQRRLPFHRAQHVYLWFLYGLLPAKWHLIDDFRYVLVGRLGGHRLARPKGWDLVIFIGGKVVFFTLAFGVPMLLHPVATVLLCYLAATFVTGIVLSVVFQLAHCVEEASFPMPNAETGRMESRWAAHQVQTTVDFARDSRLATWFTGGLNFQIEHHLLPHVCHLHYPALSRIVEDACHEFGLNYSAHKTCAGAIASHFRWLRRMGMPVAT